MHEFFDDRDELRRRSTASAGARASSEAEQEEIVELYERTLDRLEAEDYHCAPVLRRSYERALTAYGH